MKNGVYRIRNIRNNHSYIGSTAQKRGFAQRWSKHKSLLTNNCHDSIHLQRAWNKYGADSFVFEIILRCAPENCLMYEQVAINHCQPEYNIAKVAGSCLGVKMRDGSKAKMSKARMGKRHDVATKIKISQSHIGISAGSKNPQSKLTNEQVIVIRQQLRAGIKQDVIAKNFAVHNSTISNINTNKTWRLL